MSLRSRLALAAAVAVALAVAVLTLGTYVVTRNLLYGQVDDALRERADETVLRATGGGFVIKLGGSPFGFGIREQIVPADANQPVLPFGVPVLPNDRKIAAGKLPAAFRTAELSGFRVRVYTQRVVAGQAVLLARPLTEVDSTLSRLRTILLLVGGLGVGGAALLGLLVARSALRPVARLTATAEEIAETADLTRRIEVHGTDELNRLAATLNSMLDSLERSAAAQKNLVADASHELRTPLTSIRTNVELLARAEAIPADERERMVGDVIAQIEELTGPCRRPRRACTRCRPAGRGRGRATRSPRRRRGRARQETGSLAFIRGDDRADSRPWIARAPGSGNRQLARERGGLGA